VEFRGEVKERLVFDDGAADGSAKLVADEVILGADCIGEPAVGG